MYKDIVVCVNEAEGRDNAIKAAAGFASENNANLTGLYVRVPYAPGFPPFGVISNEIIRDAQRREDEQAVAAQESFEAIAKELDCQANWLEVTESQHPLKIIAYCDLVVTNQVAYDPRQGQTNISFINNLILESGKPVVLIPKNWDKSGFGSRVLLGWDESREATRAMQDALPILQKADYVEALSVNYDDEDDAADVSEISTYLSRRNVSNSFKLEVTDKTLDTPEKVLLHHADKFSADLVVIGGYGHSRISEIILGGVTRYLSKNSQVPVLFSH